MRDLSNFARARNVGPIVARAAAPGPWRTNFPATSLSLGFEPPFDRGERLLGEIAVRFAGGTVSAPAYVRSLRAGLAPAKAGRG